LFLSDDANLSNTIYFRGEVSFYVLTMLRMWHTTFSEAVLSFVSIIKDKVLCVIMMDVISFTQQLLNIWCISCANCGTGEVAIGYLNLIINFLSQSEVAVRFIWSDSKGPMTLTRT